MEKIELQSNKREVFGKKLKLLRKQKITPVHVVIPGKDSLALQSDTNVLKHVLAKAGETRLIQLKVDDEKKARQVLVRNVQWEAVTGELIHVDFYEIRKGEKVEVEIPIVFTGEAPALKTSGTSVAHELKTFTVQCLPDKIPNHIEVNISSLLKTGDKIRVKDITAAPGVTILNSPELAIAVITMHLEEKVPVKEAPAAAVPAEAAPAEGKAKPE